MDERQEGWARVGRAIVARYVDLDWQQSDLARAAGLSDTAIREYEKGEKWQKGMRRNTREQIELALGWKPGSIRLILDGGDPIEVSRPPRPVSRKVEGDVLLRLIQEQIDALVQQVDRLGQRVGRLEERGSG